MVHDGHIHADDRASGWTARDIGVALAITGGVIAAGVIMAPHLLPAFGVDEELAAVAMSPLHYPTGLAGGLNAAMANIPLIGEQLAAGGLFNAILAGVVGVGGVLTGNYFSRRHQENGDPGPDWGGILKWAGLTTSVLVSLPALLTGLAHGATFLAAKLAGAEVASAVATGLAETTGFIPAAFSAAGFAGAASLVPHIVACGASVGTVIAGVGLDHVQQRLMGEGAAPVVARSPAVPMPEMETTQQPFVQRVSMKKPEKELPANDPNHFITPEERKIVDEYNAAPAHRKVIMQKEIRARGYDPDFAHGDGTMHLYKHPHKQTQNSIGT